MGYKQKKTRAVNFFNRDGRNKITSKGMHEILHRTFFFSFSVLTNYELTLSVGTK